MHLGKPAIVFIACGINKLEGIDMFNRYAYPKKSEAIGVESEEKQFNKKPTDADKTDQNVGQQPIESALSKSAKLLDAKTETIHPSILFTESKQQIKEDKLESKKVIPSSIATLRKNFESRISRPLAFRQEQLKRMEDFLNQHEEDIKQALHSDLGKPPLETYIAEIAVVKGELAFIRKNLSSWTQPKKVSTLFAAEPASSHIQSEPLGVVLIISAWNYPIQLSLAPLIGAIAAGNCAVLKPSEFSPATSQLLATLLPKYLDPRCVQIIQGAIPEATELLAEKFDHILFTGSANVGKIVLEAAAKHLTPVTLELGGKSPCIVDRDANIDAAAERILWGKLCNAGQTCIAPDYLLAHKDIENALLLKMQEKLQDFYGNDPKMSRNYGRIVHKNHYRNLMQLMRGNGDIFVGGEGDENERYIAPTILRNVPIDAPIMDKNMEIFGPILPVLKVENIQEAVAFVNSRPKPLTLYLFSGTKKIQQYVSEHTSSGSMAINHTLMQGGIPTLPFGGVGASGMGAYHGKASFDTFSHRKSVFKKPSTNWLDPSRLLYPPATANKEWLLRKFI